LAERFPDCFSIQVPRAPLKIGIHAEVLAALNGTVKPDQLQRALAKYQCPRLSSEHRARHEPLGSLWQLGRHRDGRGNGLCKGEDGRLRQQAIDPASTEIPISHAAITAAL